MAGARMSNKGNGEPRRRGLITLFIALGVCGIVSGLLLKSSTLSGQAIVQDPAVGSSGVFTPSHPTIGLAARHFFGLRSEPVQPVAYVHRAHIEIAQMECLDCHTGALTGPKATIPDVRWCMTCHNTVAIDKPAVKQIAAYFNRGEDIPWQRVYGWNDEAHVRFNHAPHVANSIQCVTCHGDVGSMTVARRVVDHSMGFCISCHKEKKASIDCVTCHF
jgi:predicted CXXCH cytochrome family protein